MGYNIKFVFIWSHNSNTYILTMMINTPATNTYNTDLNIYIYIDVLKDSSSYDNNILYMGYLNLVKFSHVVFQIESYNYDIISTTHVFTFPY